MGNLTALKLFWCSCLLNYVYNKATFKQVEFGLSAYVKSKYQANYYIFIEVEIIFKLFRP